MKKILCIIAIMSAFSAVCSAEDFSAPQWDEFCPNAYLNVQPSRFDKDKNYWYERRVEFNQLIKQSELYSGEDLKKFYDQIRKTEITKNGLWQKENQTNNSQTKYRQQHTNDMNTIYRTRLF